MGRQGNEGGQEEAVKLGTDVLRPPLRVSAQLIEMELNFIQGGSLWFLRVLLRQEREARTHQASSPAWCCLLVAPQGGSARPLVFSQGDVSPCRCVPAPQPSSSHSSP